MNGEFKVWDSLKNKFRDEFQFFLNSKGELFYLSGYSGITKAPDGLTPVFNTGKTDKNRVELYIGDRMINKNGHEFTLKSSIEGMETCEKIGSIYTGK